MYLKHMLLSGFLSEVQEDYDYLELPLCPFQDEASLKYLQTIR